MFLYQELRRHHYLNDFGSRWILLHKLRAEKMELKGLNTSSKQSSSSARELSYKEKEKLLP